MAQAILSRLGIFLSMILAVVVALLTGLAYGIFALLKATKNGNIDKAEQRSVETITWSLAWAALRRIPGLGVE
jgi:hypothetical protein